MVLVVWDDTMKLGVKQIDEHHERLVFILNDCYRALMLNDHRQELRDIVKELESYTRYHFRTEESLMKDAGYRESPHHGEAHQKFMASVCDFSARLEAGESFITIEVLDFLRDWLIQHILRTDRALAQHLLSPAAA